MKQAADSQTVVSQELNHGNRELRQKLDRQVAVQSVTQTITIFEDQSSRNEIILVNQEHSNSNKLLSELTQKRNEADQSIKDERLNKINKDQFVASERRAMKISRS